MEEKDNNTTKKKVLTISEQTDLVITDPCYIVPEEKWEATEYGEELTAAGYYVAISDRTRAGDWSCYLIRCSKTDEEREICGMFTADSGMVAVVRKTDIMNNFPQFFTTTPPRCWAIVEKFTGKVMMYPSSGNSYTIVILKCSDGTYYKNKIQPYCYE